MTANQNLKTSSRNKALKEVFVDAINKHSVLFALICAVILIIGGGLLGWYNNKLVPVSTNPVAHYVGESSNKLSFLSNWDGPDYIYIANHGYKLDTQASFFPLYPLFIHVVHYVINSPLDSALAISWLSLIGAIYYYVKIVKKLFMLSTNTETIQSLLYFLLFPTGIFLIASYSESLFAFLALGAIYSALESKYVRAGIFSLFCNIAHLDGVFVLALACLILIENKVRLSKIIIMALGSLTGLGAYSIYLWNKFNRPLAFVLEQQKHGWLNRNYTELFKQVSTLNVVLLILIIMAILYWWNRKRSFAIYGIFFLLIPLIGNQFGGFNRYVLMDFPLQFMAYDYLRKRPLLYPVALSLIAIVWTFTALQYSGGYIGG